MTKLCAEPGCTRNSRARDLCHKHYKQKYYSRSENDRVYDIWKQMMLRCYDKSNISYPRYGGRGIKVCNRWRYGIPGVKPHIIFMKDMGPRESNNLSIERKDNNGNYEPSNCKWGTKKEQVRNTRTNRLITYRGKTQCLAAWAEELKVPRSRIADRLKAGWSVECALYVPKT